MERIIRIEIDGIYPDRAGHYRVNFTFSGGLFESVTVHTKQEIIEMYRLKESEFIALLKS